MSHNTISLTLSNTLTPFLYLPYKSLVSRFYRTEPLLLWSLIVPPPPPPPPPSLSPFSRSAFVLIQGEGDKC
ncbi:hypothetical protein IMY05_002G0206700 [Salix suchowensis]|nr:hypothetical protein IMY05_002G0206700 [Salix suchowensis]